MGTLQRIECSTQAEFDACVKDGNIAVVRAGFFVARDSSNVVARGSSSVEAWDSSRVEAWDSSRVVARGSSSVVARDSSSVVAWGSSSVVARDSSSVVAMGNSSIVARDRSRVEAWNSSNVEAWDSSRVVAWNSSSVVAWGSSSVVARGNSRVEAWDSSRVVAWNSSRVEARNSSNVEAWGNSSVVAWDTVIVRLQRALSIKASAQVTIVKHGPAGTLQGGHVVEIKAPTTAAEWCDYHGVKVKKGIATLYKAVRANYRSARGGDYTPGTEPVAPDWDGGARECGGGLHFSPTARHTREFESEAVHYLACPVALDDMRPPQPGDHHPSKIKAKGCCAPVWEVDIDGQPIKQEGR